MNQKLNPLILLALAVIVVMAITGAWFFYNRESAKPVSENDLSQKGEQSALPSWNLHTENIYRDEKFGFQLVMPLQWKNYAIQEEAQGQSTYIHFGLPLENDEIAQEILDSEETQKVFTIWSLWIMPILEWEKEKETCENPSVDYPCFYPRELARDGTYVYGSGPYYTSGGNDPCAIEQALEKEPYFCRVYRDLFENGDSEQEYSIEKSFSLLKK